MTLNTVITTLADMASEHRKLIGGLLETYSGRDRFAKELEAIETAIPVLRARVDEACEKSSDTSAWEIYRLALDTWGAEAQTLMLFEEMSELQKEVCKFVRGKDTRAAIAEEIADVTIMLRQMEILFECETLAEDYVRYKTARLRERLAEAGVDAPGDGLC